MEPKESKREPYESYVPTFLAAYEIVFARCWFQGVAKWRAEDAVQVAAAELWRSLPSLAERYPNSVGMFCKLIRDRAHSRLIDSFDKASNKLEVPVADPAEKSMLTSPEPAEIVIGRDEARRLIAGAHAAGGSSLIRYAAGYKPQEIADIEDRKPGTVRVGIHRARNQLKADAECA